MKVWVWCLLRANHQDVDVVHANQVIPIKRGQFITGRFTASEELNMSPDKYRKRIEILGGLKQIAIKTTNKYSVITVIKYSAYQDKENKTPNKTPTKPQQNPTDNNVNNEEQVPEDLSSDLPTNGKKMNTYHLIDESGNPLRRRSSGKGKEIKARNAELIKLGFLFEKLGEKSTGVKPDLSKAYFIIKNAKENCDVKDFESLFAYFFSDKKLQPEQKVSLAFCCSPSYITQWKVNQKNKVVSQVEASSEIEL